MDRRAGKVTIVGAGTVGSSVAFVLTAGGLATELVLIDTDQRRAEGQAWDLADAAAFIKPVNIEVADYPDAVGSAVVVFCAAAPVGPDTSMADHARANLALLDESFPRIIRFCPNSVYVMVTDPVDVVTYAANRMADIGDNRILGLGTVLDTSRLKSLLSRHVRVDARNIHAYVVGQQGESEVALWSRVSVAGLHIDEYCRESGIPVPDRETIFGQVVRAGEDIVARKGEATQYAVSIAVARVVEAVLRDERSVLTVSGMVEGIYGLEGPNCFSLPALVDAGGRRMPIPMALAPEELEALRESAARLKRFHREVGLA